MLPDEGPQHQGPIAGWVAGNVDYHEHDSPMRRCVEGGGTLGLGFGHSPCRTAAPGTERGQAQHVKGSGRAGLGLSAAHLDMRVCVRVRARACRRGPRVAPTQEEVLTAPEARGALHRNIDDTAASVQVRGANHSLCIVVMLRAGARIMRHGSCMVSARTWGACATGARAACTRHVHSMRARTRAHARPRAAAAATQAMLGSAQRLSSEDFAAYEAASPGGRMSKDEAAQ